MTRNTAVSRNEVLGLQPYQLGMGGQRPPRTPNKRIAMIRGIVLAAIAFYVWDWVCWQIRTIPVANWKDFWSGLFMDLVRNLSYNPGIMIRMLVQILRTSTCAIITGVAWEIILWFPGKTIPTVRAL